MLDCVVIGGGPAGLTAATYLQRFRRDILVLDAGASRARWIPTTHNCPGFPFGIAGPDLLEKLRAQAQTYDARTERTRVDGLERVEGGFEIRASGNRWRARLVLLATGIVDAMPPIDHVDDAIAAGVVRLCAICDGYEAKDERIAVYGPFGEALRHAMFLRTFSSKVSVVLSEPAEPDPEQEAVARAAQVTLYPLASGLQLDGPHCRVSFERHADVVFDTVYPVLGGVAQSSMATTLGARTHEGELCVDEHHQTSVDGLYAVGDVVLALNQISVAVGHAAVAATAITTACRPTTALDDSCDGGVKIRPRGDAALHMKYQCIARRVLRTCSRVACAERTSPLFSLRHVVLRSASLQAATTAA